ncbi:neural cell adhesion molecule 2 isoform X1 [Lates japonicus]|uniref:Neural cell adhesion molecule 2 isoform X1 n=1 Tax=Lates japonicus TaxID=270547 RepID=A0AAD3RJ24_LATJO|nr:neural cell adhesion molecule 2 isoform X1 [Lates japonicus]
MDQFSGCFFLTNFPTESNKKKTLSQHRIPHHTGVILKGQQLEPSEQYIFNRLEGGRSMLTIRNIRQGDGGTYSCKASNKAGSQEGELFLKVFVQPHITLLKNVTAVEGSAAMISCVAEGEPLPDISWRRARDGQPFVDGDKSQDGRFEVRGRHGKSVLTISGVRLADLGRFDCEALSRIGGHQKSMFLDIESRVSPFPVLVVWGYLGGYPLPNEL